LMLRSVRLPGTPAAFERCRVRAALIGRIAGALACVALAGCTIAFQHTQSRWLNEMGLYDGVFREILGHSGDVPRDLRALGLDPGFAHAAGSTVVSPNSAAKLPIYPDFLQHATFEGEIGFYLDHPGRAVGLVGRGLQGLSVTRPSYLGNYAASPTRAPY